MEWNNEFISYIFIDASGWVISSVSFGFMGGSVLQHQTPLTQMTQLTTPIPAANLRIHTQKNDHRNGSIYNFATANQS